MGRPSSQGHEYSPFDDDYRGFDAREEETARGPLILTLAIGVLLIFGAVVWNTYRQGVRPAGEGLPSVLAEDAPIKKVPEVAGGADIPNTNIRFFDGMDASQRDPVAEPPAATMELAGAGTVSDGLPTNLRRGPVEPVTDLTGATPEPPATAQSAEPGPATQAVVSLPAEPQGPRVRFAFAADGNFLVQIAALRSEEAAESAWKRMTASSPELYHGATKIIQRADLGSEGVFYRLRVGAFADRSGASAFCDAVKEAGANCIVVNG
jgi:cell division septation protein DedD